MTSPVPGPPAAAPRKRRWDRIATVVLVPLGLLVLALTPWWGRDLAFFRVSEVEVRGVRYLRPAEVLQRLAVDTMSSIWSPTDSLAARVRAHPQVREVTVRRRLPGRLIVDVVEHEPVVFVAERDGMRAFDATGRALPLDAARVPLDLPVATRRDSAMFALLGELREGFPEIYARISELRPITRNQWRVVLLTVPVLVRSDVSAERFAELSSVEADLARRQLRPVELDLRFKDQVIARLP